MNVFLVFQRLLLKQVFFSSENPVIHFTPL